MSFYRPKQNPNLLAQQVAAQQIFSGETGEAFRITHDTKDPLTRYLRDRRMRIALRHLEIFSLSPLSGMTALVVCGGAGGEASYLRKSGFGRVVNSDFSSEAVARSQERDPEIEAIILNAEHIGLPDNSFDVVLVQDGLHHLPRPALGLNEMLRVARRAVIVLEPHAGLVAKIAGTTWETHGRAINYVFRWNRLIFEQTALSQILKRYRAVVCLRIWDHPSLISKVSSMVRIKRLERIVAQSLYACLRPFNFIGNSFIGIVIKA